MATCITQPINQNSQHMLHPWVFRLFFVTAYTRPAAARFYIGATTKYIRTVPSEGMVNCSLYTTNFGCCKSQLVFEYISCTCSACTAVLVLETFKLWHFGAVSHRLGSLAVCTLWLPAQLSYSNISWVLLLQNWYTPAINQGCTRSLRISHTSTTVGGLPYNL